MAKISLTASMRSNLLSLQKTNSLMDLTQERLSTGKKVNSAIDNPSSFYTARSLNNRASDLDALLDSMGQGIQTIKAATTAIETATSFLEQAKAVTTQSLETAQPVIARVKTEQELLAAVNSGQKGFIVLENDITMSTNQSIKLQEGQSIVGKGFLEKTTEKAKITFDVDVDEYNIEDSALYLADNSMLSHLDISANVKSGGIPDDVGLVVAHEKKGIKIQNININMNVNESSVQCNAALIFKSSEAVLTGDINIYANGVTARALHVYNASNVKTENAKINIHSDGDHSRGIVVAYENAFFGIEKGSEVNIWNDDGIAGYGLHTHFATTSISNSNLNIISANIGILNTAGAHFYAGENSQINVNSSIDSFLNDDSKISIENSAVLFLESLAHTTIVNQNGADINVMEGAQITLNDSTGSNCFYLSDNRINESRVLSAENFANEMVCTKESIQNSVDWDSIKDEILFPSTSERTSFQDFNISQYQKILSQYDDLIDDAKYKGVNLLKNETLKIKFNETGDAFLDVVGKDISAANIGLTTTEWATAEDISRSIGELTSAINQLRAFAGELGNNYSIVMNRQDFTENLINILMEGADKLTLADMNEESANMLALQTRQQLAINALSLASQTSQGVLKLF